MIFSWALSPKVQAAQLRDMLVVCLLLQWGLALAHESVDAGCGAETCGNQKASPTFSSAVLPDGDKVAEVQDWLCGFGGDGAALRPEHDAF